MNNPKPMRSLTFIGCLCLLLAGCAPGEQVPLAPTATPERPAATPTATSTPEPTPEPPTATPTPTLSPMAEAFVGQWINLSPGVGYTWFTIRVDGDQAVAHFWGMCHPEPCDAGSSRFPVTDLDDGQFVHTYQFANGSVTDEIVLKEDLTLELTSLVDFTEQSGILDTTNVYHYQNSLTVTGVPAFIGTWVNDQPGNDEYTRLSIALDGGRFVILAQAMIDGQVHDFGQFEGVENVNDGKLEIDYEYPGGGVILGTCVPGEDGTLVVEMFSDYMAGDQQVTHESVITMRRVD